MNPPPGITIIPQSGQWVITGDSHIGAWSLQKGTIITDPYLFKFLRPHLEDAGMGKVQRFTVWDIGACIGDTARQYLDWGCEVIAFEPNPISFTCLSHNCPEATCYQLAASDKAGEVSFTSLENVGASRIVTGGEIRVKTAVLDDLALPKPDFLKLDIEGHELSALIGMERTITECRPLIFCEINRGALAANHVTPEDLIGWFENRGYSSDIIYPASAKRTDEQFDILFVP
jgi:FkbM family methyltransferase